MSPGGAGRNGTLRKPTSLAGVTPIRAKDTGIGDDRSHAPGIGGGHTTFGLPSSPNLQYMLLLPVSDRTFGIIHTINLGLCRPNASRGSRRASGGLIGRSPDVAKLASGLFSNP